MDSNEKRKTRERYERILKKHDLSFEAQKQRREAAKLRKAEQEPRKRKSRPHRGSVLGAEEDETEFEKIQRTPKRRTPPRTNAPDPIALPPVDGREATVLEVHRNRIHVRVDGGDVPLDLSPIATATPLVVGDRLWVDDAGTRPRIAMVQPQRSRLVRPEADGGTGERVLAANVELGLIVGSWARPAFRPALVDRIVLALTAGGIEPLIVVNKVDLEVDEAEEERVEAALGTWVQAGRRVLRVSAESGAGIEELRDAIRGSVCVLVGHSGVGKSSLLNALYPPAARETGSVRAYDGKGRHTSTSSAWIDIGEGTSVIDTPGVRSYGVHRGADLAVTFPDVIEIASGCRFSDCSHGAEPGCAVHAAVAAGELEEERLGAYLKLLEG